MANLRSLFFRSLVAVAACVLTSCAYSTVKQQRPVYRPGKSPAPAAQIIARTYGEEGRRQPLALIGSYVEAVRVASLALQRNPQDAAAQRDYNFALGRIFETMRQAKVDPWSAPLRVPAPGGGQYELVHRLDPRPEYHPGLYEFTPANQFVCRGAYINTRTAKDGLGAPLVAVGRGQRDHYREEFAMARIYYGVTALARFEGANRCVISFADPLAAETVSFAGHRFALAADFTVPLAVMLASESPRKLEIARMFRPQQHAASARISRLQPYDPNKTVVLCVHGLLDSQATWAPMINALRGDAEIRQRYQFWFYSYPSGYPYPYSAGILRHQLDAVQKRFPLRKKLVLVGHSMGGLIGRLMLTDSGDSLWVSSFGSAPAQTRISDRTRALLSDALVFKHRPEVGRAIFISTPHQGSELAVNWVGRLGSMLIRSPFTILKLGNGMRKMLMLDATALRMDRIPNSIDTLSPNNRFVKAINTVPMTPGVPYYSIVGDRGKGGNKDRRKPVSSDGVVPYWSSHLEKAQSELVVPAGHSAHQHPQAIEEVRRILLLNR